MTAHGEALADWQAVRYGDDDASRAALAYYRSRGWKVDNPDFTRDTDEIETRVFSFKAGYEAALQQAEAALVAERGRREAVVQALRKARVYVAYYTPHYPSLYEADLTEIDAVLAAQAAEGNAP